MQDSLESRVLLRLLRDDATFLILGMVFWSVFTTYDLCIRRSRIFLELVEGFITG